MRVRLTKKITAFSAIFADGEWMRYHPRVDPNQWDYWDTNASKAQIARWIQEDFEDLDDYVDDLPVHQDKWHVEYEGNTYDGTPIGFRKNFYDFGAGVVGELVVGGELCHVMVLLPGYRRDLLSESNLERLAALLPAHIREKVLSEIRKQLPESRGNLMFHIMPRSVIKPESASTNAPELEVMRVGFRWAEKRDKARQRTPRVIPITAFAHRLCKSRRVWVC